MKSAVENLNPTRVKLTVEVPYEELKPSIDSAYSTIASQIQVPGFRRGKVPTRIIDQRVGRGAVIQEAVNDALPQFFGQAVEENDLQPIGTPDVEVTQAPGDGEDELHFTVEVDVRPAVELPDFSGITVEVEPVEVTDADVDDEVESLRARFGTLVTVDRPAKTGDFATIALRAEINGEEIDSVNGVSYEIGSGNMLEGLDEALEGLTEGAERSFTSALAGGEHEGEDADCVVVLEAVKERELPELDDEFAQLASEFDTFDELREDLKSQATRRKAFEQGLQARDRLLDTLLETTAIPVPESVVTAQVNEHLEGESRLDDDEHRAEVTESTTKALQTQFLLDAIVERDEIQASQEELIEYLIMTAQQYGMEPNQFAQALDQQGQVPAVMGEVARRKALSDVLEQIKVVDTDGNEVDLSALDDNTGEDIADEVGAVGVEDADGISVEASEAPADADAELAEALERDATVPPADTEEADEETDEEKATLN